MKTQDRGIALLDELVAEGSKALTADLVRTRLGISPQAASNLLRRLTDAGLLERLRPGSYAIRNLGVLGTRAAAENLAVAVAAALPGVPHRIGYRSALDELGLLVHPARTIQIAVARRVRMESLSGRKLRTIVEPVSSVHVGAERDGPSWISGLERALLDAAARPELVGGASLVAEALAAAAPKVDSVRLTDLAQELEWGPALRRIGSIADRLEIEGLAFRLQPLRTPSADLDLEPPSRGRAVWRDSHWWVRWNREPDELRASLYR
ncbi:MAG: MarR family transcriptional regulator [Acidimicrobiia bacterium]